MRKLILSVAVLAVIASCAQNEVSDVSATSLTPITLASLNDRVATRAANDNSDNFMVLSRLSSVNSTTTGISGWYLQDVFSATTSTAVSLSNTTHYWPTGESETLDFLAIAPTPYDTDGKLDARFPEADATDAGQYNIHNFTDYNGGDVAFTFKSADGQTDLTAARTLDVAKQTSDVGLQFSHLLAKIKINVTLYQPEDDYSSPSMTGHVLNNGFPGTEDTNTYLQTTFNAHTQRGIYHLNMDGDNDETIAALVAEDNDARALPGFGYYTHPAVTSALDMSPLYSGQDLNIVPQSAVGCVIRLSDMIVTTNTGSNFFTQASGGYMNYTIQGGDIYTTDQTEADYFHPGYVYVINLVLDANTFEASTITFYADCNEWINAESGTEGDYDTELDEVYYSGNPNAAD